MRLQRLPIILSIIAEHRPERLEAALVAHEPLPEVVADLVPKMAQQRAVGLAHGLPAALAFGVISFGQRDRDHAVVVTCADLWPTHSGRVGEEIEGEAVVGAVDPVLKGQVELE
jgi:hypothetical protein